jgi:hypothetical protein
MCFRWKPRMCVFQMKAQNVCVSDESPECVCFRSLHLSAVTSLWSVCRNVLHPSGQRTGLFTQSQSAHAPRPHYTPTKALALFTFHVSEIKGLLSALGQPVSVTWGERQGLQLLCIVRANISEHHICEMRDTHTHKGCTHTHFVYPCLEGRRGHVPLLENRDKALG